MIPIPDEIQSYISQAKELLNNDSLEYFSHGMEGVILRHNNDVFKYFIDGSATFESGQLDFIKEKLLGQDYNHIVNLIDVIEIDNHVIFHMGYIDGIPFSGGHESQFKELLLELKGNEVGYRNIHPKNLIVQNDRLLISDLGRSIVPFDSNEFQEMKKRSYLTYRYHYRTDLSDIMRLALSNPDIPYLFGFDDFESILEPGFEHDNYILTSNRLEELEPLPLRNVSLMIKASPLEWKTIEFQIKHIVGQLNTPKQFNEIVVITDNHKGPFLRQYTNPDFDSLLNELNKLKAQNIIDRIIVAPFDVNTIRESYLKWFGLNSANTHCDNGQHTHTSIYGLDQCKTDLILQLDSDCIIVRNDFKHDYLGEMLELLSSNPEIITVPFPISAQIDSVDINDSELWRTEVRFSLIDMNRLRALFPLPNQLSPEGVLMSPWHRALDERIGLLNLPTIRRASTHTFFIHIQNETKTNVNLWYNILREAERCRVPELQYGYVDLIPDVSQWLTVRSEPIIFIIRGRNVELLRIKRMFKSVTNQKNTDWGCVFIDAGSTNGMEEYFDYVLYPEYPDRITNWRNWDVLTPIENTKIAISELCSNPDSIMITLDADDAMIGSDVLEKVVSQYTDGADLTVGSMLRTDKQKDYPVDFISPRKSNGGNVWQHLRTFRKRLFDSIPVDYFKIDDEWIPHTEDWAFMLPMVDIADNPAHIKDLLYFYEPSSEKSQRNKKEQEYIIGQIINKPKLKL